MRKLLAMILLLFVLTGAACAEDFGQPYDRFQALYAENVTFINENTGRFLLPLDFEGDFNSDGIRVYVLNSGMLTAEVMLDDMASQIAWLQIALTAPEGMTYGDSKHSDFVVSGYHSYALLMAMSASDDPVERYRLVEEVNNGLAANAGVYETQVGDYRLTCQSANGTATMRFENSLLMVNSMEPAETEEEMPSVEIKTEE